MLLCPGQVNLAVSASLKKMAHLYSVFLFQSDSIPWGREETLAAFCTISQENCV